MLEIVGFSLISLIVVLFLKKTHPEFAILVSAAAGIMMLLYAVVKIYSPFELLFSKLEELGVESGLLTYVFKVFGICYITKFASELCADFGQSSLSGKVELCGRAAVFLLSIPLLNRILEIASELI